ncbi:MAG TPA: M20 family peptidase [Longimicrobiales bacterium]|nr:M20 family peptidase [Longimicrobiales bacterium]
MIRKLLLGLVGLLIGSAVILIVRAARLPSRQVEAPPVARIHVDTEAAVRRFAGAVRIPTISHERVEDTDTAAFLALHAYLQEQYPLVHASLQRETVADLSLLYTWQGAEPGLEPVVLMGHQDVVPVVPGTEEDWTHGPFSGDVADGAVWGRGTMDDKVTVIAILEAVEALLADGFQPRRTVYLAFGHDEEVGGVRGAASIARLLGERGAEPYALVIDEGGAVVRGLIPGIEEPVAIVGVAEKGYVNLELLVEGAGGHSSTPPERTSIGILAEAISRVEEHPFPARFEAPAQGLFDHLAPEMTFLPQVVFANLWLFRPAVTWGLTRSPETAAMVRTTTAVTIVEGGVKANVLPIAARAVVNHRILPGETRETVLARVRGLIEDERVQVRIHGDEGVDPSPVSDPEGPAFRLLARTIRQVAAGDGVIVAPYLVMGGTDAKHYSGRSRNVFRFLPATVDADALELAHGTNERLDVDGFVTSIRFFQRLLRSADEL